MLERRPRVHDVSLVTNNDDGPAARRPIERKKRRANFIITGRPKRLCVHKRVTRCRNCATSNSRAGRLHASKYSAFPLSPSSYFDSTKRTGLCTDLTSSAEKERSNRERKHKPAILSTADSCLFVPYDI